MTDFGAPDDVTIRPMRPEDAAEAATVGRVALEALYPVDAGSAEAAIEVVAGEARAAHLQRTDPGGCWVAEADGRLVGVALGLLREGVWGFSLFGLLPAAQGRGIGTRLFAAALEYGADARGGIILSSVHPAAMRRYARTPGYRLLPAVTVSGAWRPDRAPAGLRARPGDLDADAATIAAASRAVRGASHLPDLATYLDRPGAALLVLEEEGFACAHAGSPVLLAARSEAAAEDLLWSALASGPRGATVSFDWVTAQNQWAIRVGLEAGLTLAPGGPVVVRGEVGPLAPYLPCGPYL